VVWFNRIRFSITMADVRASKQWPWRLSAFEMWHHTCW
jgi:hypothetical protein